VKTYPVEVTLSVTYRMKITATSTEAAVSIGAAVAEDFAANSSDVEWEGRVLDAEPDDEEPMFEVIQVGDLDYQVLVSPEEQEADVKYVGTSWSCSVCGHVADHRGRPCAEGCGYCLRKAHQAELERQSREAAWEARTEAGNR
jgi:hypothetical protein